MVADEDSRLQISVAFLRVILGYPVVRRVEALCEERLTLASLVIADQAITQLLCNDLFSERLDPSWQLLPLADGVERRADTYLGLFTICPRFFHRAGDLHLIVFFVNLLRYPAALGFQLVLLRIWLADEFERLLPFLRVRLRDGNRRRILEVVAGPRRGIVFVDELNEFGASIYLTSLHLTVSFLF